MSTRLVTTTTPSALERRCVVVYAMSVAVEAAVGAMHAVAGKRGQNIDPEPGASML